MFNLLLVVEIIISILLIIVVLMQSSKGGGLAGSLGGSSMGTVFGVRRTADMLGKMTTWLAAIVILLCLVINILFLPGKSTTSESVIQRGGAGQPAAPSALPPSSGAPARQSGAQPAGTPPASTTPNK